MNKEQQISEMAKIVDEMYNVYTTTADDIAEGLYNAGYRKTFTSDLANDTQKAYKEGYEKAQSELKTEIERLKAENEELTKVVSSKVYDLIDNAKEIANARETWEQQAKIDVLNELKWKMDNERYNDDTADIIRDIIYELIKEIEK